MVGSVVGDAVGSTVGSLVGSVGCLVGEPGMIGASVGDGDGFKDGSNVGDADGFVVGTAVVGLAVVGSAVVGSVVGSNVGSMVGSVVGDAVGSTVGSLVGFVGCLVGEPGMIGASVGDGDGFKDGSNDGDADGHAVVVIGSTPQTVSDSILISYTSIAITPSARPPEPSTQISLAPYCSNSTSELEQKHINAELTTSITPKNSKSSTQKSRQPSISSTPFRIQIVDASAV